MSTACGVAGVLRRKRRERIYAWAFLRRRRARKINGKPRPARTSEAGSGVALGPGPSPEPEGPSVGVISTIARIDPGAPPGWPGGVMLLMVTVYLRQPTSSAPRTISA